MLVAGKGRETSSRAGLRSPLAESYGLVKGERRDVEYLFPYGDNDALIEKGEIKEVKKQVFSSEKA